MVVEQPIAVVNIPGEVVLSHLSQNKVRFTMEATGARLLVHNLLLSDDTLYFDANKLKHLEKDGEPWYFIPAELLINNLANRIDARKFVIDVVPDTVYVRFSFAAEKMVPVLTNVSLSFAKGFGQTDHLMVEPDSIKVRGPGNFVDTLSAIYTETIVLENLNQNTRKLVHLVNPALENGISLGTTRVEVIVPVGEFTQTELELPIAVKRNIADVSSDLEIILFPNRVTVLFAVSKQQSHLLDTTLLEAYVNCPLGYQPPPIRLSVLIGNLPPFVSVVSINPAQVEYLIQP